MDKTFVIDFLIKAKNATYAGKGPENPPSRPASHDLSFEKDNLKYIDTYLGSKSFAGEEALWENNNPFWAMNYVGRVIADSFNGDFLKEALQHVPEDLPFRGPQLYTRDNFSYKCTVHGNFEWFHGREEIFNGDTLVYECIFHGGNIS
ncbi:DUF5680 domain-containing protein [Paenibacillus sp. NEAU-GSW1]|uniref:DUF5680 domain-containing protein n=1 Tax=Paenibacillus sp. NEAU-GSW1 TaxID=2682486 RepID=UPI0012E18B0B|nr:DUF5680 domain-containing protein [Paenibacillus sp. NEAU-GSW1]MUT66225.1 hypothetical protein [Paenibacillus sp. NEAU-GSW1]